MNNSILNLISICNKYDIDIDISATDINYPSELPKNEILDKFYKENNPQKIIIDVGGSVLRIFSLQELMKMQFGYRWLSGSDIREILPTWDYSSIVIADDIGGGKPIIAKIDKSRMPIYASYDGLEPFIIAKSLEQFLDSIAIVIDIVYGKYEVYNIYDENEEILDSFKDDFNISLSSILDEECMYNLYDYFYG